MTSCSKFVSLRTIGANFQRTRKRAISNTTRATFSDSQRHIEIAENLGKPPEVVAISPFPDPSIVTESVFGIVFATMRSKSLSAFTGRVALNGA